MSKLQTKVSYRMKAVNVPVRGVAQMRVLVLFASLFTLHFVWWFASPEHIGYEPLFWLLTFSLGFRLLRMAHEWYHYVSVAEPQAPAGAAHMPRLAVDMLTTACPGEPLAMIEATLRAMQAVQYPHTSYLCDEGDDPRLRALCAELGVVHVTRTQKIDAKAGNINNALHHYATGELCVVLDPDHAPTPDFLDRVLPYFADPAVGFVQVVQAYGNQHESLVARGAAEQTYHFYGPLMMGMNRYGTVQAIGANCTFRRAALDSIGGHAAGLTEDMHTAMRLHAAGWESVYVPAVVSRGLVPSTLAAFYAQQLKWSRGAFDLLFRVYPRLFRHFTWKQRLHYLILPLYFLTGMVTLIDVVVPPLSLLLGQFPWHVSLGGLLIHATPVIGMSLLIRLAAQRWLREPHEVGLHLMGGLLRVGTWWVYALGFFYAIIGKRVPYIPTPKEGQVINEWRLVIPNLVMAVGSLAVVQYSRNTVSNAYVELMAALTVANAVMMLLTVLMAQHRLHHQIIELLARVRPLRWLTLALERLTANMQHAQAPRMRSVAIVVCLLGTLAFGWAHLQFDQHHAQKALIESQKWTRLGDYFPHSGLLKPVSEAQIVPVAATVRAKPTANTPRLRSDLVGLQLAAGSTPPVPAKLIQSIQQRNEVPVLQWQLAALPNAAWWRQLADLSQPGRPLLVRPVLLETQPDAYRRVWRQMVNDAEAAGASNLTWIWTPLAPENLQASFPGNKYVNWVSLDFSAGAPASPNEQLAAYLPYQQAFAEQIELHRAPLMLLLPPTSAQAGRQADALAQRYPEVRAVLFVADTKHQLSFRLGSMDNQAM